MANKICLGGSFNPVHHGHLLCARAVVEAVGADAVVLIPTGVAPHKQHHAEMASAQDRLAMCKLAIQGNARFEVDDREIRRDGPSYTIESVRQFKREGWTNVRWVIGADMLNILPTWHLATELVNEAHLLIMARPGWSFDWDSLPAQFGRLRQNVVQAPQIDISSTEIRRRVRLGLGIDYLTPPAVCRYIVDHNLYR